MRCACIDVGSNTTRLLVADADADADAGALRDVFTDRAFTLIGRSMADGGSIPAEKVEETAEIVSTQADRARELGAERIRVVATAAIRTATNAAELTRAIESRAGMRLEVLDGEDEARLAFRGAAYVVDPAGTLAVIDLGGGSTEIAVGTADGRVTRADSIPIGSSVLTERHLRSDPPTDAELDAVREDVALAFDAYAPPDVDQAVAVGGSASSLLHVAGGLLGPYELRYALDRVCSEPSERFAAGVGLDAVRVRMLPGAVVVLAELARRLRQPLGICKGGLREGVILEMIGGVE